MEELNPFRAALRAFVRGEIDEDALRVQVTAEIIKGPSVVLYQHAEPDVAFSATLDAASMSLVNLGIVGWPTLTSRAAMTLSNVFVVVREKRFTVICVVPMVHLRQSIDRGWRCRP